MFAMFNNLFRAVATFFNALNRIAVATDLAASVLEHKAGQYADQQIADRKANQARLTAAAAITEAAKA